MMKNTRKIIYIFLVIIFLLCILTVLFKFLYIPSHSTQNEIDNYPNTGSSENVFNTNFSKEDSNSGEDLSEGENFQNYNDWKVFNYSERIYKPFYSKISIPNIDYVFNSEQTRKRIEMNGVLTSEYEPIVLAIIKMLNDAPFSLIRIYMEPGGISKYKDIWASVSVDIILDKEFDPVNQEGNELLKITSIFAKNDNGTWIAAYEGSSLKNDLIKSVPDEYFIPPFYKENFYNYSG